MSIASLERPPRARGLAAYGVPIMSDPTAPLTPGPSPLGEFIRLNRSGTLAAAAAIAAINAIWFGEAVLYLIPLAVVATFGMLLVADRRLAAGQTLQALGIVATGNWMVAVITVGLLPWTLPVMVLTAMMPIVLATPYVERRQLWPFLLGTGVTLTAIGWLGIGRDDDGVVDDVDAGIELGIVVLGMIGAAVPIGVVVWQANRYHRRTATAAVELSEELVESRRRLVVAGDEERSRLERDLHDGAQQRLIAVAMRLRMMNGRAETGDLGPIIAEVEAAMADIRHLANGLSPALLETAGLDQALSAAVRRLGRPTTTRFEPIGRLDRSVETALYFCGIEAVQNALKHADGAGLTVELVRAHDDVVVLTVSDTGPGFDPETVASSNGMINMSDRMASIGGTLVVDATPGGGATIRARVPVAGTGDDR